MDPVKRYEELAAQNKWQEALPLIQEIVKRAPQIATSWFNLGVCLAEVDRLTDAAKAFQKAYQLDPEDYGAQYRIYLSLYKAGDLETFFHHLQAECERDADTLPFFLEDEDFSQLFEHEPFKGYALSKGYVL